MLNLYELVFFKVLCDITVWADATYVGKLSQN